MARILIVANFLVPPIIAGSCRCVDSYCLLLRNLGHEVYFLYSGRENDVNIEEAKCYWGKNFLYYKYSSLLRYANYLKRKLIYWFSNRKYSVDYYYPLWGLGSYVNECQKKYDFDAIIVNYIWMTKLLAKVDIQHKILFSHDSFTNKSLRILQQIYSLSANQEAKGLQRCDAVLSIQDNESIVFNYLVPHIPIYTVYMPIPYKYSSIVGNKNILFFSGNSDINLNGIHWFINEVFSQVVLKDSEVRLLIGGGICRALNEESSQSGVELLGLVDDVDSFYQQGDIVINPVYQGTGLKIKTLEGISYGKIAIVHPHSVDGLYKHDKAPVLVAYDREEYVRFIVDAIDGRIDKQATKIRCENYIDEMNSHIVKQYNSIKLK